MLNNFFDIKDDFNFETEKQNFVDNLDMLKLMSVQESTLYKKWQEFNKDEYKMRTKAHKFDIIKSKLWKPTNIYDYGLTVKEINNFSDSSNNEVINASVGSNMKGLMSKMISCVINYPSLVNDPESSGVIDERAKKLSKSDVLMELIHSAQIEPDITKDALIKPYENKNMVFSRLKKLSVMEPFLSENEAKIEFMSALTAAEKHQQRKLRKASILSAKTKAEEKKIAKDISRRKMTSGYNKKP